MPRILHRVKNHLPRAINALVPRVRIAASRTANQLRDLGLPLRPIAQVIYHEAYVTCLTGGMRHTFDGRRPLRIVEQLRQAGVISRRQLIKPSPATTEDLQLVHPEHFIEELKQPATLARLFHLPIDAVYQLDHPLTPFLYQAGGTIHALDQAIRSGIPAFNLGGGFHHAQRDRAEGFCPFNDIAIAIERARRSGLVRRVIVIDLDYHHGNGTALIFASDEDVLTVSIHGQHWARVDHKHNTIDIELPAGTSDEPYLRTIRETLSSAVQRFRPEAAIYLAGADPFIEDPLGDFNISEDGMLERDLYVWQLLRRARIPLAVVLGGGYGSWAWTCTYNFICSVLTQTRIPPQNRPSNIGAHFRRVGSTLGPAHLRRGDDREIDEAELTQLMSRRQSSPLFMGTYTVQGIELALEEYGFLDLLRERGFDKFVLDIDTTDDDRQAFHIYHGTRSPERLLLELIVRYRVLTPPTSAPFAPIGQRALSIEWLVMQDPRGDFTLDRPKLPGQRHPGLGVSRWMFELLRMMAERLGCVALVSNPDHYHNARLYGRKMRFWDPLQQGRFEALGQLLASLPLFEAAWAVEQGKVLYRANGAGLVWQGEPQVYGLAAPVARYLRDDRYDQLVRRQREADSAELELALRTGEHRSR